MLYEYNIFGYTGRLREIADLFLYPKFIRHEMSFCFNRGSTEELYEMYLSLYSNDVYCLFQYIKTPTLFVNWIIK